MPDLPPPDRSSLRPAIDPDLGVYVISIAAELAGVHAQTLRSYERHGLLDPDRTEAGDRRYSENDLHRLGRISQLAGNGVSLGAVKQIIELQDEVVRLQTEVDRLRERLRERDDG